MKMKMTGAKAAAVLLAGVMAGTAVAVDVVGKPPVFRYDGEIEIAAPMSSEDWTVSPDGAEEFSIRMSAVPKEPGQVVYRPKDTKKPVRCVPLPEGMLGMDATVRTLDDGRVAVAFVCPNDMDATTGFRMNVWIGPWASLKASSTRGFYRVSFNRPRYCSGTWLPKDLKAMDAKYRALAEGRAKGNGAWDDPVTVDLTTDLSRFSTIHESEFYDAHASSIMLPDEKTMFCFWDLAYGGPCGPAAKSTDGGRTWTDISEKIPAELRESNDAPVAFRFVDPKTGKARLRVFAGYRSLDGKGARGPADRLLAEAMPSVMSEDDGRTWTYVPPMGADFTCVISFFGMERLKDGSYLGVYQRHPDPNGEVPPGEKNIAMIMSTVSRDGGLTWEKPNLVAQSDTHALCEPAVFYSPDKSELCMLIRENSGKHPSQMCFSKDDGRTWSELRDAPLAMKGHRHVVERLPDGRYLVVFRLVDFRNPLLLGWVGPYESIKDGTGKGGYLISLFPNYGSPFDCGYQGMHLKTDGEIVINTYTKFRPWANATPSIVSMRFKIEEADALVAARRAYWADQLAAVDEAKKGVEPAKEALARTARPQKRIVPFADEVKAKKVTLLTEATVYGSVRKDPKTNGLQQMAALTKTEVKARNGLIDVGKLAGVKLSDLAPWYAPLHTAYVKWEVESEKDGKRVLRILNDYYGTVFVNGEQLPSTYGPDGTRGTRPFTGNLTRGLRLTVDLKKGKNEIVLMTSPGSAGQWLCAAAIEN